VAPVCNLQSVAFVDFRAAIAPVARESSPAREDVDLGERVRGPGERLRLREYG
jgi:hypothetical protein